MRFSAVLLAGGKSSRMGCDKAALCAGGEPLWMRQTGTLRATGPAELFISGPEDGPFAGSGVPILPDAAQGSGPLGGIVTALRHIRTEWLLVLAVDMPAMTPEFLREMLARAAESGRGVVPMAGSGSGCAEPLAAVYPRAALDLAESALCAGRLKVTDFARAAEAAGLVQTIEGPPELFDNWNSPGDVRC